MIQDPRLKTEPELIDLLNEHKRNIFLSLNCHAVAQIESFNPAKQTVKANIVYKRAFVEKQPNSNKYVEVLKSYTPLVDCPVVVLSGGTASLTMPISQGDFCLILFNDRDIDAWFTSGQINQPPTTPRAHAFTDAIAIVGLFPITKSIQNFDTTRAVLRNQDASVGVGPTKIQVKNASYNLKTELTNLCSKLNSLCTAINNITVGAGTFSNGGGPVTGISGSPLNSSTISSLSSDISTISSNISGLLE